MTILTECKHYLERVGPPQAPDGSVQPGCTRRVYLKCLLCGFRMERDCRTSRRSRCEPCATKYRRRVRRVAASGLDSVLLLPNQVHFLTFTAPGNDVHFIRGQVVCPCTPPGGVDLRVWNGRAAKQFNRLKQDLERKYGVRFEHFRAVECQERGALHYHVAVRSTQPVLIKKSKVRALAIKHGFGHEVDVQAVTDERCASYMSKYVSKSSDERGAVPYMHPVTGEIGPGRWRTWSSSRGWGDSMKMVRAQQVEYMRRKESERDGAAGGAERGTSPPPAQPALDHKSLIYTTGSPIAFLFVDSESVM